jgi:hypothetical protein
MVRKSLTYPNFKLMSKAFAETENFINGFIKDDTVRWTISRDKFLSGYFSHGNKKPFIDNVRDMIVNSLQALGEAVPDSPVKVNDKREIETKVKFPKFLVELITGRVVNDD